MSLMVFLPLLYHDLPLTDRFHDFFYSCLMLFQSIMV